MDTIAKTFAHDLEDALDELERQYLLGEISREERNDRRDSHIAWFEARGIEGGEAVADLVPYLVNFPNRTKAVLDVEIGRVAGVGTEILDGWVVDKIESIEETIDDKAVSYEVWVRPKLTH